MPRLFATESSPLPSGGYQFSHESLENLGSSEYTLVTVALDISGSTHSFHEDVKECMKSILRSCRMSPRADSIMMRVVEFNHTIKEIHGYVQLANLDESIYDSGYHAGGTTDLFGAMLNTQEAAFAYGDQLTQSDYSVNAINIVVTDGYDTENNASPEMIKRSTEQAFTSEKLESILSILVGLNEGHELKDVASRAGINQFIPIQSVDDKAFAKLAQFISSSIDSQSQALGTGGPSQLLNF
jgi:hypothetical protein